MQKTSQTRTMTPAILFIQAGYALCGTSIPILLNSIITTWDLRGTQQGLPGCFFQLGGFISVCLIALLGDGINKCKILVSGAVIQALLLLILGISPWFSLLLAGILLAGFGGGLIDVQASALMFDLHPKDSAPYLGMLHSIFGLSCVVTPLLIRFLLCFMNWQHIYLLLFIPLCFFAAYFFIAAQHCQAFGNINVRQNNTPKGIPAFLRVRKNILIMCCFFFYRAGQFGLTDWIAHYMAVEFHDENMGAVAVSIFWICTTVSRFFVPRLTRTPSYTVASGLIISTLCYAGAIFSHHPAVFLAACGFIGISSGHTIPMLLHISAAANPDNTSVSTSLLTLCNRLSSVIMPLLLGLSTLFSFKFSISLGAVCFFISFLFSLMTIDK